MKPINRLFLAIVLICLVAALGFAAGPDAIVYVTKTGAKYHTATCSSLRSSKIEITLGRAVLRGYEPCKTCRPPVLDAEE